MSTIRVGLMGIGVVGGGVVRLLRAQAELIEKRTGIALELVRAADRNADREQTFELPKGVFRRDPVDIVRDPEVDVVVELLGGQEPARSLIVEALQRGKSVVTANKALLATSGPDLFQTAADFGLMLGFEASVAGTIPIVKVLREGLVANRIDRIIGILNGTTNFILTRMAEDGLSYNAALAKAQELGLAEADPSLDVDGEDAAQKLAILAGLAFGIRADRSQIPVEGIRHVTPEQVARAKQLGYALKLVAIAKQCDNEVELRVHPTLLPQSHPLAAVRNEFNAIFVVGDASGETMYYGRGAGSMPTASAVVADLLDVADARVGGREGAACVRPFYWGTGGIRALAHVTSQYYLRFPVLDEPGVIGQISTILGRHGVSITGVRAHLVDPNRSLGMVEVITHKAREGKIAESLAEIRKHPVLQGSPTYLRIEE